MGVYANSSLDIPKLGDITQKGGIYYGTVIG
jgi:hypothetical protein